jgi:hypothetical protein
MTIEELQQRKITSWKELQSIHSMYVGLKSLFDEINVQYKEALDSYSKADHELALVDGRCKKVDNTTTNKKPIPESDAESIRQGLSEKDIEELLNELNIQVPDVEEVPNPNDVVILTKGDEE